MAKRGSDDDMAHYAYAMGFVEGAVAGLGASHRVCSTGVITGGMSSQVVKNYLYLPTPRSGRK